MKIARITNPGARLIMIGDESTKKLAKNTGWDHSNYNDLASSMLDRFLKSYRLIATLDYAKPPIRGEMIQFVFARYFYTLEYASRHKIGSYWMFDSDEIIVEELSFFAEAMKSSGVSQTRMADNSALRGLMSRETISKYCQFLINLFEDSEYLNSKEDEYSVRNDDAAFSEMLTGGLFPCERGICCHLEKAVTGWHFDDCIMHKDDFEMIELGHLVKLPVKHVRFNGQHFTGIRSGQESRFATINGSGLPRQIFSWFLDCVKSRSQGKRHPSDITAYQPSLMRELAYIAKIRGKKLVGK